MGVWAGLGAQQETPIVVGALPPGLGAPGGEAGRAQSRWRRRLVQRQEQPEPPGAWRVSLIQARSAAPEEEAQARRPSLRQAGCRP